MTSHNTTGNTLTAARLRRGALSLDAFLWHRDENLLTAEASCLPRGFGTSLSIVSPATGRIVGYRLQRIGRDADGDIVCWDYSPYAPIRPRVRIYND